MTGLLDQFGRPYPVPPRGVLTERLASARIGSVRQAQSGHPADNLTPEYLGSILRQAETGDIMAYLELAEQMEEKDLHYAGVLGVRKRAIRKLDLVVDAASDDPNDVDAASAVRSALKSAVVKEDLIMMLDALGKGFSVTEIMWNIDADPWRVQSLEECDPRFFRFDDVEQRNLMLRQNGGDEPLQPYKFICHFARLKSGIPIRSGLARLVAWAYIFKNYSLKDWAVFLEAYGHPLRLGKYDAQATDADKSTLLRAVRNIGTDMAAIIPRSMEIAIENAAVTPGDKLFEGSARFWDEQISKAVLGQVGTTDAIAGGHAVGKVHNEVRADIRDSDAEQLAATLQRDFAAPLTMILFGPEVTAPRVRFEEPDEHDPRIVMQAVKMFGPMGLSVSVPFLRETFGIREPQDGEDVLSFSATEPADATPQVNTSTGQGAPNPDSLTEMLGRLMDAQAEGATDPLLSGIFEALGTAQSLEEVRDVLAQLALGEPDETIAELISRLTLTARVAGEVGAEVGRT